MNLDAGDDNTMAQTQTTKRKTAGRPRKGPSGERVSDYPRLTIRLPRATKNQLEALSMLRRVPVWDLVDKAVRAFIEQLPDDERKPLTQFSRRMGGE